MSGTSIIAKIFISLTSEPGIYYISKHSDQLSCHLFWFKLKSPGVGGTLIISYIRGLGPPFWGGGGVGGPNFCGFQKMNRNCGYILESSHKWTIFGDISIHFRFFF